MSTTLAINSDPACPWFGVSDFLACPVPCDCFPTHTERTVSLGSARVGERVKRSGDWATVLAVGTSRAVIVFDDGETLSLALHRLVDVVR